MQEFSNKINKPIDIYNVIKVLLLGTDEQINIARQLWKRLDNRRFIGQSILHIEDRPYEPYVY